MRKEGRTIIENQAKNAPRRGPEGPKSRPGGLRGASGRHVGPKWPQEALQIALGGGPGGARKRKKIQGAPPGRSWAALGFIFHPPQGSRRLPERLPEGLRGGIWELFFELVVAKLVFREIAYPPHENLVFEGSGGQKSSQIDTKIASKLRPPANSTPNGT